ncbi:hypothetical protein HG536_0B06420 [Torulaspora globosa]|uniref:Uncharacterized protein n=1 Tax=Torulaspora globosa TaxID=48254 RepID=A0A7G3ZE38_9SACH|nr:uncharacterized protein HG536_0B06420 [Torulaspora globosa]QLL31774.1 hypothetical protein HG536_0B06420 [Torulaspora globosa]
MNVLMCAISYIPPNRKLFNSRHKLTRRELQSSSAAEVDWSTTLDVSLDEDSSLILYAVPVVGSVSRCGRSEDRTRSSTMSSDSGEDLFEPDLRSRLQSSLSLESLIQENKKRISAHHESLDLINSTGHNAASIKTSAKQEIAKLRDRNTHLFGRAELLQEQWDKVRRCHDPTVLLIEIGKNGLYWFGIPSDLRPAVYRCCLYQLGGSPPLGKVFDAMARCCADEILAAQIYQNIRRIFPFITDPDSPLRQANAVEARLSSKYPGLHYHLTQTLKLNLIDAFVRPFLINALIYAFSSHASIGMELLDVVVLAVYYRDLGRFMLDEFLFSVLEQTHFKFFSDRKQEVEQQLTNIRFELADVLEESRRLHGRFIIGQVST